MIDGKNHRRTLLYRLSKPGSDAYSHAQGHGNSPYFRPELERRGIGTQHIGEYRAGTTHNGHKGSPEDGPTEKNSLQCTGQNREDSDAGIGNRESGAPPNPENAQLVLILKAQEVCIFVVGRLTYHLQPGQVLSVPSSA